MGHVSAVPTPARQSRVVAGLLSLCTPSPIAAGEAHAATRARGQTIGATLPATDPCHGSWKNESAVDGKGSALVPLASGLRLRATQARSGRSVMSREVDESAGSRTRMDLAPGREGLSGLPHDQTLARSGPVKGWSNYPPCPLAARHLEIRLPVSGPSLRSRAGSERSEGALRPSSQTLRCAQGDKHYLQMSNWCYSRSMDRTHMPQPGRASVWMKALVSLQTPKNMR